MQPHNRSNTRSPSAVPSRASPGRTNHYRHDTEIRDDATDSHRTPEQSSRDTQPYQSRSEQDRAKHADKINQVIQNLFKRAALIIVSSRVNLTPTLNPDTNTPKTLQWFQLVLNESDELNQKLDPWRYKDFLVERAQSLVIELYLDIGELTRNQTLAVIDDRGKKWDVCEALQPPKGSGAGRNSRGRDLQVVLERWTISLDDLPPGNSPEATEAMANVYKKASITMHSLLAYANLLPAFKFARRTMQDTAALAALRPQYRIVTSKQPSTSRDSLTTSLYPSADQTCENYKFWPLQTPAGRFKVQVAYRKNCNFQISNYEELVSADYFGGVDVFDRPSGSDTSARDMPYTTGTKEAGSLPTDRKWTRDVREVNQAYGSLSTFHYAGHTGTSPISALRAARDMNEQSPTANSLPQKVPPNHRTSQSSKSSLKSNEAPPTHVRRPSVSFQPSYQPFKAGSLSSSPAQAGLLSPSPSSSYNRPSDLSKGLAQARNIRQPVMVVPEVAVGSPTSGSPRPAPVTRYSSSFGNRHRSRLSSGGTSASKEEENNSSGSSSKRGSATLGGEPTGGSGSSGSVHTDDDSIGDLIKMLDQKKDLKSLHRTDEDFKDASSKRTASALSRYRGMRESNAQLSDSLSSSVMMHRSSGSSSQRLSSGIPPTLVGTSVSTSSSKPVSPHTPAIPSRLSEETNARVAYRGSRYPSDSAGHISSSTSNDDSSETTTTTGTNTMASGPIPIPPTTSPQGVPVVRRSSSANHRQHRRNIDIQAYDPRPSSVPLQELGLNDLFDAHHDSTANIQDADGEYQSAQESSREEYQPRRPPVGSSRPPARPGPDSSSRAVRRPEEVAREGPSRSRGSRDSGSYSGGRGSSSRFSFRPVADDDEPLLFTMNELSRTSLERLREPDGPLSRAAPADRPVDRRTQAGREDALDDDQVWSG